VSSPAGWYPDPNDPSQSRYWDGAAWTEHTHGAQPAAPSTPAQPTQGDYQPGTTQPLGYQPGGYQQPGAYQQPGGYDAGAAQPTGYQPGGYQPGTTQPGYQPGAYQPGGYAPGSTTPAGFLPATGYGDQAGQRRPNRAPLFVGLGLLAVVLVVGGVFLAINLMGRGDAPIADPGPSSTDTATTQDDPTTDEPTDPATDQPTDGTGATDEPVGGDVDVFSIVVGDCFNDQSTDSSEISSVPVVPCSGPHDNEIYAETELTGDAYPGDDAVAQQADQYCYDQFETFVGAPYETSALDYYPITPLQSGWEELGDRLVSCAVYDMAGPVTGTLRGSGR